MWVKHIPLLIHSFQSNDKATEVEFAIYIKRHQSQTRQSTSVFICSRAKRRSSILLWAYAQFELYVNR
jgi:hypothetical protein